MSVNGLSINFDKRIILGVASAWSQSKGLFDFIALDKIINHDLYQIVLVGLNDKQLPNDKLFLLKFKMNEFLPKQAK